MSRRSYAHYVRHSLAPSTRDAYASDIRMFRRWGGDVPAKPDLVAKYLASQALRLKVSTLHRRLASISHAHTVRGLKSPTDSRLVHSTLRGIQRVHGCATKQARPLTPELVKRLCKSMKTFAAIRNVRDRALLLVGYTGALRRSELANLERRDVTFTRAGAVVRLRASKTDPGRKGRDVALPRFGGSLCPVKALRAWMEATEEPAAKPLFRRIDRYGYVNNAGISGEAIGTILRQRLHAARIDPTGYSAHSMRAGFVTTATRAGASAFAIQQQTGQRSIRTVHGYIRGLDPFEGNAAHALWGRVRNA
jgi:site-specific recombinase XerD